MLRAGSPGGRVTTFALKVPGLAVDTAARGGGLAERPIMPIARYRAHQQFQDFSELTINAYQRVLRRFDAWLEPRTVLDATTDDVIGWLVACNVAPSARSDYLSRLSAFYQWALDEELVVKNPCRRVPRPRLTPDLPHPITEEGLAVALASAGPQMRCYLLLGAKAGFRCKEIAGLCVEDLRAGDPAMLFVSCPKGRRTRSVPLHPEIHEALRAYGLPSSGRVFVTNSPKVSREVSAFLHGVGVEATAHALRHRYATVLYQATRDLRLVQELMGHSSPATTAIYTKIDPAQAASVVAAL